MAKVDWLNICKIQLKSIEKKLEKNPNDLKALLEKAVLFYEPLFKSDEAVELIQSIINKDPSYIDAYMWLGEILADHMCDEEEAEKVLKKCLFLDSTRADCHLILASSVLPRIGKESEYHYREAIKYQPTWPRPRLRLVYYLLKMQDYEKAKKEAQEALQYALHNTFLDTDLVRWHYEFFITGRYDPDMESDLLNAIKKSDEGISDRVS